MDFTLAGFTFHFQLDPNGNVVKIVTPDLAPLVSSTEIAFNPAITVAAAEASVIVLLTALGLYP